MGYNLLTLRHVALHGIKVMGYNLLTLRHVALHLEGEGDGRSL